MVTQTVKSTIGRGYVDNNSVQSNWCSIILPMEIISGEPYAKSKLVIGYLKIFGEILEVASRWILF